MQTNLACCVQVFWLTFILIFRTRQVQIVFRETNFSRLVWNLNFTNIKPVYLNIFRYHPQLIDGDKSIDWRINKKKKKYRCSLLWVINQFCSWREKNNFALISKSVLRVKISRLFFELRIEYLSNLNQEPYCTRTWKDKTVPRRVIKLRKQRRDSKINRTTNRMREILLQYFLSQHTIVFPNILFFFSSFLLSKNLWHWTRGNKLFLHSSHTHHCEQKGGEKERKKEEERGEKMKKRIKKMRKRWKKRKMRQGMALNIPGLLKWLFCLTHTTKESTDSYIWQCSITECRRDEKAAREQHWWQKVPCLTVLLWKRRSCTAFQPDTLCLKSDWKELNLQLIMHERWIGASYVSQFE